MNPYDADEIAEPSLDRDSYGTVQAYRCGQCDTVLAGTDKHPVVTVPGNTGTMVLFCSWDCREAWVDEEAAKR